MLLLIALVALAVRLAPLLLSGGLRSLMIYDDGVHLAAAQEVLGGSLPYADFTLLHPPGVVVLMLPFAAMGELLGSDVAMAAARLAVLGVAVLNSVLIAHLLRGFGTGAQLVGGGLSAVWAAAAVGERTILLEPLLNLGVLVALLVLSGDRGTKRLLLAGAVLGLSCSIKVWPALLAAAMLVGLLAFDRRGALPWTAGVAFGGLVWGVPTLLVGGRTAIDHIVTTQAGRGRSVSLAERLTAFDGIAGINTVRDMVPVSVRAVLVATVLLVLLGMGLRLGLQLWTALSALTLVEVVVLAPSFYPHYAAYVAPGFCLLAGAAFSRVPRGRALPTSIACGAAGVVLAFGATNHAGVPDLPLAQVQAFADAHDCVWTNDRTTLVIADADTPRDGTCPVFLDGYGESLLHGEPTRDREAIEQLRRSDAALVVTDALSAWPSLPVQRYLQENFAREEAAFGPLTAWTRRRP